MPPSFHAHLRRLHRRCSSPVAIHRCSHASICLAVEISHQADIRLAHVIADKIRSWAGTVAPQQPQACRQIVRPTDQPLRHISPSCASVGRSDVGVTRSYTPLVHSTRNQRSAPASRAPADERAAQARRLLEVMSAKRKSGHATHVCALLEDTENSDRCQSERGSVRSPDLYATDASAQAESQCAAAGAADDSPPPCITCKTSPTDGPS